MADDVTITVRVNDATAAGFRDVNGRLRDMNGRFATTAGDMRRSSSIITKALVDVKASLLSLAPAAIPVAASFAPIAVQAGAAGLAVGAFGAAVAPQIGKLGDAAKAQDKYSEAVRRYGAQSKQAVTAQQEAAQTLADMPAATQRAAAAYSNLRQEFQTFSDSTARFTMAPVEKSFAVLGQIIPKLTPMVEGTSTQLDRLMNVAGGAVNTSGFDSLSKKVSDFANNSLKNATDGAIHFIRVMSEGNASGPMAQFMDYAREQGPAVKELFTNLSAAVGNVAEGAAQAGPGLLTVVNALAKIAAAVPPGVIGNLMQMYAAFKLIKLGGAGLVGVGTALAGMQTRITTLTTAAAGATGTVGRLRAGFAALGTTTKASIIVGGLALITLGVSKLAEKARGAPPDVDKLTSSLKQLASTGKFTGELRKTFGDVNGLVEKMKLLGKETEKSKETAFGFRIPGLDDIADKIAGSVNDMSKGDKSLNALKDDFSSLDQAMAGMVSSGNAKEAAKDFETIKAAALAQGYSLKEISALFPQYTSNVSDANWEQEQAAKSMGIFATAAQAAQAQLTAQKASADGLRQSIQALNDVNRQGLGGMIGFEAAIDAAAKAAKDNAGALSMNHGVLDLNSEKARNAASALQDLADKTDSAAASARESGSSWETVNGIYTRGRDKLIEYGQQMGLSKEQARQFAQQILDIPDEKSTRLSMIREDAQAGLEAFNAALRKTPGAKSVTLKTLSSGAETILEAFGYKVKRLPNGKVTVSAATGTALSGVQNVAGAIASLNGNVANTYVNVHYSYSGAKRSDGATFMGASGRLATGGQVPRYADGDQVQMAPTGLLSGPGTGTSDDILALFASGAMGRVSDTEFVVNARSTKKYLPLLEAINKDRLPKFASGGMTDAMKQARSSLSGQFGISSFGRAAGYSRTPFEKTLGAPSDVSSLVSSLNQLKGEIKAAFSGKTESRLLKQFDSVGKSLIKYEKQLTSVNKSLEAAKSKLSDLKSSAASLASSVKSGILSSASITRGVSGDTPVTTSSIMGGLIASRDKATAFAGALKGLKEKGLTGSLIQQIAEAGIEGGGLETAGALLGASSSEISTVNDLQAQINSAAGAAGKNTADAVYAAAIKAQTASVNKLQHTQDKLEKTMASLAKTMEKALKQALGGKAAGGIVGGAASGGLRAGLTWVGEHEPELLQLPAGSRVWSGPDSRRKAAAPWESMLTAPRRSRPAASAAAPVHGGGQQTLIVRLQVDKKALGEVWVDVGQDEVRHRGSIEATLKPPRGR